MCVVFGGRLWVDPDQLVTILVGCLIGPEVLDSLNEAGVALNGRRQPQWGVYNFQANFHPFVTPLGGVLEA